MERDNPKDSVQVVTSNESPTIPHVVVRDVEIAADRIRPFVHRTPILASATLTRELGAEVIFKCENLQRTGSFKARGALNAVLTLREEDARSGVVTHSSGNHGQALAYAASQCGIACTVVMPNHAPPVKIQAVRDYGGRIVMCRHDEREEVTASVHKRQGSVVVHPYNDPAVIAGQGTAALEMLEEVPDLDVLVVPVGGGGLMAGSSVVARAHRPGALLIGAEPEQADDAYRSLQSGELQPAVLNPRSVADGLLMGLGSLTFDILKAAGVKIVTVSEPEIMQAVQFHLERMKLLVEPSGATALAALRGARSLVRGARVGVILSGGNAEIRRTKPRSHKDPNGRLVVELAHSIL